jgi:hypothetical protein
MPIVMMKKWKGITAERYDKARKLVNWERNVPKGTIFHVASDKEGARVTDVWESAEEFNNFVKTRLMPGVQQLGIAAEPAVEIYPTHTIFAPAYKSN